VKAASSTGLWPTGSAASAARIASSQTSVPVNTVLNVVRGHSIAAAASGVGDGDGEEGEGTTTADEGKAEGAGVAGDGVG